MKNFLLLAAMVTGMGCGRQEDGVALEKLPPPIPPIKEEPPKVHTGENAFEGWPVDDDGEFITRLAYFADGKRIASVGSNISIWDIETGKRIRTMEKSGSFYCLAVSPNGKRIMAGSPGGALAIYDVDTGKNLFLTNSEQGWIHCCAFSPDSERALVGGDRFSPMLWHVESSRILAVMQGHTGGVGSVAFSKDGDMAISVGTDNTVKVWDVPSGRLLKSFDHRKGGRVSFSAKGQEAHCRGWETNSWNLETGKLLSKHIFGEKDPPFPFNFSPDGKLLIWGAKEGNVGLWQVDGGKFVRKLEKVKDKLGEYNPWEFSPDAKELVAASRMTFYFWDVETGKLARSFEGKPNK